MESTFFKDFPNPLNLRPEPVSLIGVLDLEPGNFPASHPLGSQLCAVAQQQVRAVAGTHVKPTVMRQVELSDSRGVITTQGLHQPCKLAVDFLVAHGWDVIPRFVSAAVGIPGFDSLPGVRCAVFWRGGNVFDFVVIPFTSLSLPCPFYSLSLSLAITKHCLSIG